MNTSLKVLYRELGDLRAQANKPFLSAAQELFIWAEVRRVECEISRESAEISRQKVWG